MELANSSIGLIEEPVFSADALQTLKKLAEGTATDVAVKNRKAAPTPRIPLLITANYDFVVQGGSTEKAAFATRMKKYIFKAASGFLKLAKKKLNPGIWYDLFAILLGDETDGNRSDDTELREYLNMTTAAEEEAAAEAALLCNEPMFNSDDDTE